MRSLVFAIFFAGLLPTILFNPYCGVLLWSWISFMSPQQIAYGFMGSLPVALIVAVPTLLAWLFSREPKLPRLDATAWLIIALMALYTLNTIVAIVPEEAFPKWELIFKSQVFVLVTLAMLTSRVRIQALVWIMAISISFYAIKSGAGAIATGGGARVWGPPNTMIEDNNHFAVALLVSLPLINYLRMSSAARIVRIGTWAVMLLTLLAAVASYSRGAFIALSAISLFMWLKSPRKIMPAIVIAIAVVGVYNFMPEKWFERINSIENYSQDDSANTRLSMWRAATEIGLHRPLTGAGFLGPYDQKVMDTYSPGTTARAVHSIYFEVIGENGFIAFALWLAIPIVAWRNTSWVIRRTRDRPDLKWANDLARMIHVSLIAYLVGGAFLSLSYWDFYFTIVAIAAALRHLVRDEVAETLAVPQPGLAGTRTAALTRPAAARRLPIAKPSL